MRIKPGEGMGKRGAKSIGTVRRSRSKGSVGIVGEFLVESDSEEERAMYEEMAERKQERVGSVTINFDETNIGRSSSSYTMEEELSYELNKRFEMSQVMRKLRISAIFFSFSETSNSSVVNSNNQPSSENNTLIIVDDDICPLKQEMRLFRT